MSQMVKLDIYTTDILYWTFGLVIRKQRVVKICFWTYGAELGTSFKRHFAYVQYNLMSASIIWRTTDSTRETAVGTNFATFFFKYSIKDVSS